MFLKDKIVDVLTDVGLVSCFNTGLVNKLYQPIYFMFSQNKQPNSKWVFDGFCVPAQGPLGKRLVSYFNPLPSRAHYFENISDMFYDTRLGKPIVDWEHIVIDNISRFPINFIRSYSPKNFELIDPSAISDQDELNDYYKMLADAYKGDKETYRHIINKLETSLSIALLRAEWNYKTAIPMYFPRQNKMSLLLPLSLENENTVDLALVVEKTPANTYLGHTVFPLDWAYQDARLVCRPDSDWLTPAKIDASELVMD